MKNIINCFGRSIMLKEQKAFIVIAYIIVTLFISNVSLIIYLINHL